MTARTLRELPSVLLMTAFVATFGSCLDYHLAARGMLPSLRVYVFLWSLVAVNATILIGALASARQRTRLVQLYWTHRTVLVPLTAIVVCSFIGAFPATAHLGQGPRYVLYPAYYAVVVMCSMLLPFRAHHRRRMRTYLLVAFALAAGSIFVDVINPATFSPQPDRAAGFAMNPNGAAFLLVSLCCALIVFDRVRTTDLIVIGVTALGVLATWSRGGFVLLAFVVGCYAVGVARHGSRRGGRVLMLQAAACVLLLAGISAAAQTLVTRGVFGSGTRVQMFLGEREIVTTNNARVQLLAHSWDLIRQSPLLGYGSGYSFAMPQGPHNIYLSRWLDNGLIGLVSFVWLLVAACVTFRARRYTPGLVFTGVLAIEGLFSHNLLDERVFHLLLGMMLTASALQAAAPVTTAWRFGRSPNHPRRVPSDPTTVPRRGRSPRRAIRPSPAEVGAQGPGSASPSHW